jgi:hypothetical protein
MSLHLQYGRPAVDIIARLGRQLARLDPPHRALPESPPLRLVERASAQDGDFARIQRWTQWIGPRLVRPQTAFWVVPPRDAAAFDRAPVRDGAQQ